MDSLCSCITWFLVWRFRRFSNKNSRKTWNAWLCIVNWWHSHQETNNSKYWSIKICWICWLWQYYARTFRKDCFWSIFVHVIWPKIFMEIPSTLFFNRQVMQINILNHPFHPNQQSKDSAMVYNLWWNINKS